MESLVIAQNVWKIEREVLKNTMTRMAMMMTTRKTTKSPVVEDENLEQGSSMRIVRNDRKPQPSLLFSRAKLLRIESSSQTLGRERRRRYCYLLRLVVSTRLNG